MSEPHGGYFPETSEIPAAMVTSLFELPGHRITRNIGIVRGIVVRSRSIVGNFGAGLQMLFGGNISLFSNLCERARREAYERMAEQARLMGANAVVAMRYDATEITAGVTEVLAYGTAVVVEETSEEQREAAPHHLT